MSQNYKAVILKELEWVEDDLREHRKYPTNYALIESAERSLRRAIIALRKLEEK